MNKVLRVHQGFLAVVLGHLLGCKLETAACDCGDVVVLSLETPVTTWAPQAREKADEELVITVSLYC